MSSRLVNLILSVRRRTSSNVGISFAFHVINPFRAPKSLPVLTASKFVPQKGFQCIGVKSIYRYLDRNIFRRVVLSHFVEENRCGAPEVKSVGNFDVVHPLPLP